jgi:hypothetical protein
VAERNLVPRAALNLAGLGAIAVPAAAQPVFRPDNGEKEPGIATIVPPRLGKPYTVLLPQLDEDGNEVAGIRMPALSVPLATYTGWNLRSPQIGAPHELLQLTGGRYAFARLREERAPADTRAAITERYASREDYLARIAQAANALVAQRLLLKEDVAQVLGDASASWDLHLSAANPAR